MWTKYPTLYIELCIIIVNKNNINNHSAEICWHFVEMIVFELKLTKVGEEGLDGCVFVYIFVYVSGLLCVFCAVVFFCF